MVKEKGKTKEKLSNSVLVVGSGVAGIRASLDLAESGHKVTLVDQQPNIGGILMQLDRQFPTNDCGICKMLPTMMRDELSECCIRRNLTHPNITIYTSSKVQKVTGAVGAFEVSIQQEPEFVDPLKCILCGKCEPVCPVEVPNEFNDNLNTRKAIYTPYPLPNPYIYTLDSENCTKCGKCVEICPTSAIDLNAKERKLELSAGAIILATGLQVFDPIKIKAYGYGTNPNILTSIDFERIYSGLGPYSGERKLIRPSDQKVPKNLAFIQCVGSRNTQAQAGHEYCSYACCMYSLKEAMLAKERHPEIEITIYYMDMRAFGKGYHEYYERAKSMGINFVRSRVPTVQQISNSDDLELTLVSEKGKLYKEEFEMVVLSVGLEAPSNARELAKVFDIKLNEYDFNDTSDFTPIASSREGIYVCGGLTGPKDIPETVTEASAAAAEAAQYLAEPVMTTKSEEKATLKDTIIVQEQINPAVGVLFCTCGTEIESKVDIPKLKEYAESMPNVVFVDTVEYLCLHPDDIKNKLLASDEKINRLIIAACTPYQFEVRFKASAKEAGINPTLVELINLRERLAWVCEDTESSIEMAKHQLEIAYHRLIGFDEPKMETKLEPINKRALVVGGGIAGMSAAITIAKTGFTVDLVEKTDALGGNLKDIHSTLTHEDTQGFLKNVIKTIFELKKINVYTNSRITDIYGYVGNFSADISSESKKDDLITNDYATIILATGAHEYEPNEYSYGENPRVITQLEFEKILAGVELDDKNKSQVFKKSSEMKNIAMIQCIGSRNDEHPYCSRVCCAKAIKNAIKFKKQNPKARIYIIYQDIMTYGLFEKYYLEARTAGIEFVRYEPGAPPVVTTDGKSGSLTLKVPDILLGQELTLDLETLILSTGIVPNIDDLEVFNKLGIDYTNTKFLQEANVKFRPVDLLADGIFVAGLAHSPRLVTESIAQGQAAAGRALTILKKPGIPIRRDVSEVNTRKCSGCEMCITACPYHARILDSDEKIAVVIEALCQGCGACAMVCPNGAAIIRGLKRGQVYSMIDAAAD